MKNLFTVLFVISLVPFSSLAQSGYKPGYVVTLKGDTLRGSISCKTGARNPTKLFFKYGLPNKPAQLFLVGNTAAFVINGNQIYKRFVVEVSQDEPGASSVRTPLNTKPVIDTVFLNLIDSGKNVALYQYTDKIKQRFFIAERNARPAELIFQLYPNPELLDDIVRHETYKRQLQRLAVNYLPQFQPVLEEIQDAGYTREDIEKIIVEINGGDKAGSFTARRPNKARPFIGAGTGGLLVQNLTANGIVTGHNYNNITTQQSLSFQINAGEDLFLSEKENAMLLRLELHSCFSGNSTISDGNSSNVLEKYHTFSIAIHPQLLYNLVQSGVTKVFIGAGGQLFVLGGKRDNYFQPDFNELNPPAYYPFSFSFTARADLIFNNTIDLYAGYNLPASVQYNHISALWVGLNYLFGAK